MHCGRISPLVTAKEGIVSFRKAQCEVCNKENLASKKNKDASENAIRKIELEYVFGDNILSEIGEKRLILIPSEMKKEEAFKDKVLVGKIAVTEIRNYFNYLESLTQLRLANGTNRDDVDFIKDDGLAFPKTGSFFNLTLLYDMVYDTVMSHIPEKSRTPETEEDIKLYLFFNLANVPFTPYMNRIYDTINNGHLIPCVEKTKEVEARRKELLNNI